jgi:hypothetical protein
VSVSVCLLCVPVHAQIPARNVNMVSGTQWPGGDPFLQRQNEPSVAVSTRNPLHLLAGANDYRTVDLPGLPGGEVTSEKFSQRIGQSIAQLESDSELESTSKAKTA